MENHGANISMASTNKTEKQTSSKLCALCAGAERYRWQMVLRADGREKSSVRE